MIQKAYEWTRSALGFGSVEKGAPTFGGDLFNIGFSGGNAQSSTPRRGANQMLKEFGENTQLQNPIDLLATGVGSVRWRVVRVDDLDPEDETAWQVVPRSHPLVSLLRNPSPDFTWSRIMWLLTVYMETVGEAFLMLDSRRGPTEMLPIPPTWVTRRPYLGADDDSFRVSLYSNGLQFVSHEVSREQMLWFRRPDPRNPWRGLGKAFAIDDELTQYTNAHKLNGSVLRSGAFPGTIIGVKNPSGTMMSDTQRKQLQSDIENRYGGFWRAGKPMVIGAEVSVADASRSQRDMQFIELLKFMRDTSHQNWAIPPELLGIMENANRASTDGALYHLSTLQLVPRLEFWREEFGRQLVPRFGDEAIEMHYISPVRETAEFILNQANEGLTRGALKVDEWRKRNGFKPLGPDKGGDERLIPTNTAPAGALANQSIGAPAVDPTPPAHDPHAGRNGKALKVDLLPVGGDR